LEYVCEHNTDGLILNNETENEGPMKVTEAKVCEVKLYDYCEGDNCFVDCPKKYGKAATVRCGLHDECFCDYPC